MLHYCEAKRLFQDLKQSQENLTIKTVIISNLICKTYGRTHLRTTLTVDGNFTLFGEQTYISDRIPKYTGQELVDEVKSIFDNQLAEVLKLKATIKSYFPKTHVHIFVSGYDLVRVGSRNIRLDDLMLTGEPALEIRDSGYDETDIRIKWKQEWFAEHAKSYQTRKTYALEYKEITKEDYWEAILQRELKNL